VVRESSDHEAIPITALADALRDEGEVLVTPIGDVPRLAAHLAQATHSPDLMLSDGARATLVRADLGGDAAASRVVEAYMPFRTIFDVVWSGRRHVIMGAAQIDRHGNQNIAAIGDWRAPRAQLLGLRGAPGNVINHAVSYWIPEHTRRVFVPEVDVVSGPGHDRIAALGAGGRFHRLHVVVTNLATLDFATPDRTMRLRSLHPGVELAEVLDHTGFELTVPNDVPLTRQPTDVELQALADLATRW
jgi:acyl CoA:acetate/3-ketoacid CoA transferase beta subunit